ncbi:hypothetical protein NDU88_000630 [Pleurodeles waltl]|uniref:Uncharacterized protein n=1 Tax=Pleurodeles waltl TaxID=8319 RepID=A0AAV7L956_PLEWA|nr:hypothetical protein NDU88_000630 [Pleurodeles waltl]
MNARQSVRAMKMLPVLLIGIPILARGGNPSSETPAPAPQGIFVVCPARRDDENAHDAGGEVNERPREKFLVARKVTKVSVSNCVQTTVQIPSSGFTEPLVISAIKGAMVTAHRGQEYMTRIISFFKLFWQPDPEIMSADSAQKRDQGANDEERADERPEVVSMSPCRSSDKAEGQSPHEQSRS